MREPKYGHGDIITIKKDKKVGIIKDLCYNTDCNDYIYFVSWLGEFFSVHRYQEPEIQKY